MMYNLLSRFFKVPEHQTRRIQRSCKCNSITVSVRWLHPLNYDILLFTTSAVRFTAGFLTSIESRCSSPHPPERISSIWVQFISKLFAFRILQGEKTSSVSSVLFFLVLSLCSFMLEKLTNTDITDWGWWCAGEVPRPDSNYSGVSTLTLYTTSEAAA